MTKLGIIGRHDAGGLGTLTSEVFRHLKPERTLLLNMGGAGRGEGNPSAYDVDGATQSVYPADYGGKLAQRHIEWLAAEGIDTLWSAETFYDDEVLRVAHQHGIRTVCYTMPELNPWNVGAPQNLLTGPPMRPRELHTPTAWEIDRMGGDIEITPFPIALDRLPWKMRGDHDRPLHLYHVGGAAMLDRNGTDIFLSALSFVTQPIRVSIRTERALRTVDFGNGIDLKVWENHRTECYWDSYPDDADVLVMPRRYGGLSLPIQEAAALGMPSIVLTSDAYTGEQEKFTVRVAAKPGTTAHMKGGDFTVRDADPRTLAEAIDHLARDREIMRLLSYEARAWAEQRAWSGPLGDAWATLLR